MSGTYKWEEVNCNNNSQHGGQESQEQTSSKENTSSSRIDHLLEQRRQQTNSNSNGHLYQSDTIDLPSTSYASSKKLLQSSAFSLSPPRQLFNQLAVMELEQNVWGSSNHQSEEEETMTFTPISTTNTRRHINTEQNNESGVDTDDDVEQYTNFIDQYESSFIPDDEDGSNVFEYEVDRSPNYPSSYHDKASSYDGITSDFTNTPSFNSKGRFTDYTERHQEDDEEEVTNRVHYDSTSGSGGYTNRKKRRYCIITSVTLTTLAIAVLVTMFLVVIPKSNDKELPINRFYEVKEEDGVVLSESVVLVQGMGDAYLNMKDENSAVVFHKVNAGPTSDADTEKVQCIFRFRYSNGSNHHHNYLIKLNGIKVDSIRFNKTGGWSNWKYTKSIKSNDCLVNKDGMTYNDISIESESNGGAGYIYLDGLDFKLGDVGNENKNEVETETEESEVSFQTFVKDSESIEETEAKAKEVDKKEDDTTKAPEDEDEASNEDDVKEDEKNKEDTTSKPQGEDLIVNGDFEDGLSNWYMNKGSFEIDSTNVYSGRNSVLLTDRSSTWNGVEQTIDAGKVKQGAKYHVSCYAKIKGDVESDHIKVTFRITDANEKRHYIPGEHNGHEHGIINNSTWTYFEGYATIDVPGEIASAMLYVEGPGGGVEYWVDDVSAVEVE